MKTFAKVACCALFFLAAGDVFAGYDAHISRAKDWTESKNSPIPLNEWKDFVKGDKEFRPVDADKAGGMAIWTDPKDKKEWYFSYHEGEISVKDPEGDVLNKMKSIARKLKAKVIGDEGEEL
jgi:hypothetical protein